MVALCLVVFFFFFKGNANTELSPLLVAPHSQQQCKRVIDTHLWNLEKQALMNHSQGRNRGTGVEDKLRTQEVKEGVGATERQH